MKLKIGAKILASYLFVLLMMLSLSFAGLYGIGRIEREYDRVVDRNLPMAEDVWQARALILEQAAAIRGFMLYKDEKYTAVISDCTEELEKTFSLIEDRIENQKSREDLLKLRDLADKYKDVIDKIVNLIKEGKTSEAFTLAEEGRKYADEVKAFTSDWSKWVTEVNSGIVENVQSDITKMKLTAILIIVLAAAVSIISGAFLTRSIAKPLAALTEAAGRISGGKLNETIPQVTAGDEISDLSAAFARMVASLRELILSMNEASESMVASSQELAASSEEASKASEQVATAVADLAAGASEQALLTDKLSAGIRDISEGFARIASEMSKTEQLSESAKEKVSAGEKSVRLQEVKMRASKDNAASLGGSLSSLAGKSAEIGEIVEVIRSIAEQTNLLSLNAAIEAARAGEQGKGFSVVAGEVRKLAAESGAAVKRIGDIIKEVRSGIDGSVSEARNTERIIEEQERALGETVAAFKAISDAFSEITENVRVSAKESQVLSENTKRTAGEISKIASITQDAAAGAEEVSAATEQQTSTFQEVAASAESLSQLAGALRESIRRFEV